MIFDTHKFNLVKFRKEVSGLSEAEITSEHLAMFFFARFPHSIFKTPNVFGNEAMTENVHFWNGKFWERINSQELQGFLNRILKDDLHIAASVRKRDLISGFLSEFIISDKELNVNAKFVFNTLSGVIDLNALKEVAKSYANFGVEELLESKASWLLPHENLKGNHLTCMANVKIPESYEIQEFEKELSFFKKTFLKTLGNREDSYDWLLNLLSACLSGERKGDHFTVLFGQPATGKTTLMKFFGNIFGNYFQIIEPEDLTKKTSGAVRKFYNSRFARIINLSETADRRIPASFIKKLTGNSEFRVGAEGETFSLDSHIMIDTNHILSPDEDDPAAFLRRIIYLPFGPQVQEDDMDKRLSEKLEVIKTSFFLDLFLRFPRVNPPEISPPAISKEVVETIEKFNHPIQFFYDSWCVPALDLHGGKNIHLTKLRGRFVQEFFYYYEEEFQKLFYSSKDFHKKLSSIGKATFNAEMQNFHHYVTTGHGGDLMFHNLIVHHPGNFETMRKYQIEQLKNFYCVALTDEDALQKISDAEKPPVVAFPQDISESNFNDTLWSTGFPSFMSLGIFPSKIDWENHILNLVIHNDFRIQQWLNNVVGFQEAGKLLLELSNFIWNLSGNYTFCMADSNIRGILNTLFELYISSVRKMGKNRLPQASQPFKLSLP